MRCVLLCMLEVPEVMRRVRLRMLGAGEGGLCLLDVLDVMLCVLEVVEGGLCLREMSEVLEVLEAMRCYGGGGLSFASLQSATLWCLAGIGKTSSAEKRPCQSAIAEFVQR